MDDRLRKSYGMSIGSATVILESEGLPGLTFLTVKDLYLNPEEEFRRVNPTMSGKEAKVGSMAGLSGHGSKQKDSGTVAAESGSRDFCKKQRIKQELPSIVTEFITTKHSRTKVFSGNKKGVISPIQSGATLTIMTPNPVSIPKLAQLSTKIVTSTADRLVGFEKLSTLPLLNILRKVSVKQLVAVERNNPGVCARTNELWKMRFSRDFKGIDSPSGGLSWRDAYSIASNKREASLKNSVKPVSPSIAPTVSPNSGSTRLENQAQPKTSTVATTKRKLFLDDEGFLSAFNAVGKKRVTSKMKERRTPIQAVQSKSKSKPHSTLPGLKKTSGGQKSSKPKTSAKIKNRLAPSE